MVTSANTAEVKGDYTLDDWGQILANIAFPMLEPTARGIEKVVKEGDNLSIDRFCDSMLHDPGAVLTMLRRANSLPRGRLSSDVTTLENASMLIGVDKVKDLHKQMKQLALPATTDVNRHYMQVASRAFHAAYQAYDWAVQRADMMPKESFVAAFMHEIGEMALLLHGGDEVMRIHELMTSEDMPADEAEYVVLGFSLEQLSHRLAVRWKLPELVSDSMSAEHASNPRVYGVMLACQLANYVDETGWYTDKVQGCMERVSDYLEKSFSSTVEMIHVNAVAAARESQWYGAMPAAALLPRVPEIVLDESGEQQDDGKQHDMLNHFCLMPQIEVFDMVLRQIQTQAQHQNLEVLMGLVMLALHDGLGLNRVVFAMPEGAGSDTLVARYLSGTDNDPEFSKLKIPLAPANLFTHVMKKSQSIWLNETNKDKFWKMVPDDIKVRIETDTFFAGSVFVNEEPVGLFYADRHILDCKLDEAAYKRFKVLIQLVGKAIEAQRANKA